MRHVISAVVVSLFAIVFLHGAWAIRLLNPVFTRYLGAGLPGGPNVLLTVRGRPRCCSSVIGGSCRRLSARSTGFGTSAPQVRRSWDAPDLVLSAAWTPPCLTHPTVSLGSPWRPRRDARCHDGEHAA